MGLRSMGSIPPRPGPGRRRSRIGRSSAVRCAAVRGCPAPATASSGITSNRVRKPSFFWSSRAIARPLGQDKVGVEEQLARVVAGLAMDVHGPGEVGRLAVVQPVGIGEPGVGLRQDDQLAGSRVVQAELSAFLAGQRPARRPGMAAISSRARCAIVGSGRRRRGPADGRRRRTPGCRTCRGSRRTGRAGREQAGLAEDAVQIRTGRRDVAMAVLADDPDPRPDGRAASSNGAQAVVQLADEPGHVAARGAEPLGVVIEVRQVDERQVGPLGLEHRGRRTGDPLGAGQPGARAPEGVEREAAERRLQPLAEPVRRAGDAEDLVAVGSRSAASA